jgi:hypothetical protein
VLTPSELQLMLADLESGRIERALSTSNTVKFAQPVCAFANDLPHHGQPDYLIFGVDDGGEQSGLQVNDQLLRKRGDLCTGPRSEPSLAINVSRGALARHSHGPAGEQSRRMSAARPNDVGCSFASCDVNRRRTDLLVQPLPNSGGS